jgi:hypothetical protein
MSAQVGSSSTSYACKDQFQHKRGLLSPVILAKTNFSTSGLFIHQLCLQRPISAQVGSSSTRYACKDQFQHKWALHPSVVLAKTNISTNGLFITICVFKKFSLWQT